MTKKIGLLIIAGVSVLLISCGKKEKPKEQVRSIKTITITSQATGQIRKFSGVIYAVNNSKLSFEDVSGRVAEVKVDIGDSVKLGDVLAVLDTEKYGLDVKNEQAELKKAEANMVKAESDFQRADDLYKKEVISKRELETKTYQLEAAKSEVIAAKANLGQAERNLRNTTLRAPFDGSIGERMIEPQQLAALGQKIFRLDAAGAMEVRFDIPEGIRRRVNLNDVGRVILVGQPKLPSIKSTISFLGSAANTGNAFPVKAQLIDTPSIVKPGMTAEISLTLPVTGDTSGFLIPPAAVLMGNDKKTGYVFIYDPVSSTVRKTEVHFKGSQGNLGIASSGIKEGDTIAVAGVAFLLDGMKVNLYKPRTTDRK